jgi:hypothetical protein
MSSWIQSLARTFAPIVNAVNTVIQAVAPRSPIAQIAQTFTRSVNTTAGVTRGNTPVSFSDTIHGTESRPSAAPAAQPRPGQGAYSAGDEVEPVRPYVTPTLTPEQRRRIELNQRAEESNREVGLRDRGNLRDPSNLNPGRNFRRDQYWDIDSYETPLARQVRDLDDTSFAIYVETSETMHAATGNVNHARTAQLLFGGVYADELSDHDIKITNQLVNSNRNRNRNLQNIPTVPGRRHDGPSDKASTYTYVSLSDSLRETVSRSVPDGYVEGAYRVTYRYMPDVEFVVYEGQTVGFYENGSFRRINYSTSPLFPSPAEYILFLSTIPTSDPKSAKQMIEALLADPAYESFTKSWTFALEMTDIE